MHEIAAFLVIAAAFAAVGTVIGMLVAPAISRWTEREDEEPGDGDG